MTLDQKVWNNEGDKYYDTKNLSEEDKEKISSLERSYDEKFSELKELGEKHKETQNSYFEVNDNIRVMEDADRDVMNKLVKGNDDEAISETDNLRIIEEVRESQKQIDDLCVTRLSLLKSVHDVIEEKRKCDEEFNKIYNEIITLKGFNKE